MGLNIVHEGSDLLACSEPIMTILNKHVMNGMAILVVTTLFLSGEIMILIVAAELANLLLNRNRVKLVLAHLVENNYEQICLHL